MNLDEVIEAVAFNFTSYTKFANHTSPGHHLDKISPAILKIEKYLNLASGTGS